MTDAMMRLRALVEKAPDADLLQMIDSTSIRAHHCAAGGRGGLMGLLKNRLASDSMPHRCDEVRACWGDAVRSSTSSSLALCAS